MMARLMSNEAAGPLPTSIVVHAIFKRTQSIKKTDKETGILLYKGGEVHEDRDLHEDDIGRLSCTRTRKRINFFDQFNYHDGH